MGFTFRSSWPGSITRPESTLDWLDKADDREPEGFKRRICLPVVAGTEEDDTT